MPEKPIKEVYRATLTEREYVNLRAFEHELESARHELSSAVGPGILPETTRDAGIAALVISGVEQAIQRVLNNATIKGGKDG